MALVSNIFYFKRFYIKNFHYKSRLFLNILLVELENGIVNLSFGLGYLRSKDYKIFHSCPLPYFGKP